MKMKKILALLLSFMLVLGSVPVAMAADGMTVTVEASDKEVTPGDVVTFDVELTDAEDIRGIELRLKVSDGLTVESFEKADAPDGWFTSVNDKTLGLAYAGAAGDEFSGDITLATLTCTVDDDAAGDLYVSITTCKIADINNEPADFETTGTGTTIITGSSAIATRSRIRLSTSGSWLRLLAAQSITSAIAAQRRLRIWSTSTSGSRPFPQPVLRTVKRFRSAPCAAMRARPALSPLWATTGTAI